MPAKKTKNQLSFEKNISEQNSPKLVACEVKKKIHKMLILELHNVLNAPVTVLFGADLCRENILIIVFWSEIPLITVVIRY